LFYLVVGSETQNGPPQEEKIKVIPINGEPDWNLMAKKEVKCFC